MYRPVLFPLFKEERAKRRGKEKGRQREGGGEREIETDTGELV